MTALAERLDNLVDLMESGLYEPRDYVDVDRTLLRDTAAALRTAEARIAALEESWSRVSIALDAHFQRVAMVESERKLRDVLTDARALLSEPQDGEGGRCATCRLYAKHIERGECWKHAPTSPPAEPKPEHVGACTTIEADFYGHYYVRGGAGCPCRCHRPSPAPAEGER